MTKNNNLKELSTENHKRVHKREKRLRTYETKTEQESGQWVNVCDRYNTHIFVKDGDNVQDSIEKARKLVNDPMKFHMGKDKK